MAGEFVGSLRSGLVALFAVALCSCGGGGSGSGGGGGGPSPNQPRLTLSASALNFQSPSPFQSFELAPVTLTGSIGTINGLSGTLYIVIEVGNGSIITAGNFTITGETTGQVVITPAIPSTLGPGVHQTTVTVRACMNSPNCSSGLINGSPITIPVTYTVPANVLRASVTPAAVAAVRTSEVVLRGAGFNNITSVQFGGAAAVTYTRISATEIRATVPSLAAGTYAVSINGGAVAFNAALAVVAEPAYAATTIALPAGVTANEMDRPIYDAPRSALLTVVRMSGGAKTLYRYVHAAGAWTQTGSIDVSDIRDLELTPAGDRLYLVRPTQIDVLDPVTLQVTATISRPSTYGPADEFVSLGIANDGYAVVTGTFPGSGHVAAHMMATTDHAFTRLVESYMTGTATIALPDGSRVAIDNHTSYNPATARIVSNEQAGFPWLFPRALGMRFSGTGTSCDVMISVNSNGTSSLAGDIPVGSRTVGCGTDRWVNFAYIIDVNGDFSIWNVLAAPVGGVYSRINAPYTVPGINLSMVMSPMAGVVSLDGRTHFIATLAGVVVMPVP